MGAIVTTHLAMKADEPTANGRIYPKKVLEDAVRKYCEKGAGAVITSEAPRNAMTPLDDIVCTIKSHDIDEDGIKLTVKPLQVPKVPNPHELARMIDDGEVRIVSAGYGKVSEEGVVESYDIIAMHLTF